MTKPSKLYINPLTNPRQTISFRDFELFLVAFGFTLARTTGSHRQYVHPRVPDTFPIQPTGKDAKAYQVHKMLDVVDRYGLAGGA
jgi:predicted RNA binding protein YcfA (HicA-like mRNA interferase family)